MGENLKLKIKNLGPISDAEINLGKITVVGGVNSSGKTIASKTLYSFLRSGSNYWEDLAYFTLLEKLKDFEYQLLMVCNNEKLEVGKEFFDLWEERYSLNYLNMEYIIEKYHLLKDAFNSIPQTEFKLPPQNDSLLNSKYLSSSDDVKIHFYVNDKQTIIELFIDEIEDLIRCINVKDYNGLHSYFIKFILNQEFIIDNNNLFGPVEYEEVYNFDSLGGYNNDCQISLSSKSFDYIFDISNRMLGCEGLLDINSVYYLESFCNFDFMLNDKIVLSEHYYNLHNALENFTCILSPETDDVVYDIPSPIEIMDLNNNSELENKISEIIGGNINPDNNSFYSIETDSSYHLSSMASGIKQMAIIQFLINASRLGEDFIHNYNNNENHFIILDEPEVNLHPEWQVKYAEVLVLIAKELGVNIYINSHSPMFIEAIGLYSELYDLIDDTKFYLTEKGENGFNFRYIDYNNISEIYRNLCGPFDELNKIRRHLKERDFNE